MSPKPAVKLIALLKKKPDLPMAEFEKYYENHHVPLVLSVTPYIRRYVRNYVNHDSALGNLDSLSSSSCDVITEAWFDSEEDFRKFNEAATKPETRKRIVADELKFLDRDALRMFLVKECGGEVRS
jgi:uncharacterized protein (TIGR02118 family)